MPSNRPLNVLIVRKRMSRRSFLRASGATVASAAFMSACGGFGGDTGGGGGGGPVTFSFGAGADQVTDAVKAYKKETGNEVVYQEMPTDSSAYFDRLRTEFEAGAGKIDVIGGDVIWPAQFAANGWILDISDRFTEEMQAEYLEPPILANTHEGGIYGVPWFTDAGMLYYRKDLLEQEGIKQPPKTWTELHEMADQVAQATGTKNGFVFQGANYEGGTCNGLEHIWTHGGDVLDPEDPTQVIIDSPESVAAMETYRAGVESGVAPEAVAAYKEPESAAAFETGDAVFCRNWPYMFGEIADPKISKIKPGQVDVTTLPVDSPDIGTASALGGWNFFINADTELVDDAWEFIQFASSEELQKTYALDYSLLMTRKALYEDQEILSQLPAVKLGGEVLVNAKPRPVTPFYSDISLELAENFNGVLTGDVAPDEAITTLQDSVQGIVEQGA
ncbi:MAG: extracellular solute-binding protein [Actinomycetota bacterium]